MKTPIQKVSGRSNTTRLRILACIATSALFCTNPVLGDDRWASAHKSESSAFDWFEETGLGHLQLRVETLSMQRDYEGLGNGYSTTLGWDLLWLSPEWNNWSAGFCYLHEDVIDTGGGRFSTDGEALLFNGRVNIIDEAFLQYRLNAIGLGKTTIIAGRQLMNNEVFRKDEFRQKHRSFEAVLLESRDIDDVIIRAGHTTTLSNVWQSDSTPPLTWRYTDFPSVFGVEDVVDGTAGVTWAETVITKIPNLEFALFNAYAYELINLVGGRFNYKLPAISEDTSLIGYYRHESDLGNGLTTGADAYGLALGQKAFGVTGEAGFYSVTGDDLYFNELTTGINHPLGASMMIRPAMFNDGAFTYYLKATHKIERTNTKLYMLYNYTTHDVLPFDGQELNVVISQPITEDLSVAVKYGIAERDYNDGSDDTLSTDARLFVTYFF